MRRNILPAIAALLLLSGCGNLFDSAAAVVDGTKVTSARIDSELERFRNTPRYERLTEGAPEGEIDRDFEQTFLTLLIREAVLEGEAEERGIEVTPEEVNERIDAIKEEIGSEGQFQEALKEEGLALDQLEFQVRVQLLGEKLRAEVTEGVGASEEDLRAYYENNIDDYQEIRAQHILVDVSKESLAQKLADQLQNAKPNEIDDLFASLAKKNSEDPSTADSGGDLGFAPASQYAPPFREAVADLEVGVVSDPVQTEFGWHVIRLTARRVTPFEEARAGIEETIGGEAVEKAWQEWLADAYEEADIRVNEEYGTLNPESQSVENLTADDVPAGEAPDLGSPSPEPSL